MGYLRTVGVRLRMYIGDYLREEEKVEKANGRLKGSFKDTAEKGKKDFHEISTAMGVAGAALFGLAATAVYAAAKFDKQMSEVGAVADASAEDMKKLRDAALEAGAATVFSATEAAQAEAELAKAGVSAADILAGALTGALDLAAAGSLELETAATIAAAAMNTFKLKGQDVGHIADVLAAAANKSSAGVEDLGQGLQQVGLIAAQVGFTMDETVALLAAFADYGLKGSDGATSLKTALLRLAAPTGEAADTLNKLGISMYDANGQLVDAATIAGQLQLALKDLAPAQRNAALNTIFGSDAIRAANILYEEGRDGIQDYIDSVNDQGAASRNAAAKMDNLSGDVEALTGSLETLFITSGEGANEGLRVLVQALNHLVDLIAEIPKPLLSTGTIIAGLSGVALIAAAAGLKLRATLASIAVEAAAAGRGAAFAATSIRVLGFAAGRALAAVAALGIALEVLDHFDIKVPGFEHLNDEVKIHKTVIGQAAEKEKALNTALEDQLNVTTSLIDVWNTLTGAMVNTDKEALDAHRAIADLTETFKENKFALDQNTKAGLENRVALENAAREAVEAADAYAKQTGDTEGAAKKLKEYEEAAIKATGATGKQKEEVKKLADELFRIPETKKFTLDVRVTGQIQRVQSALDRIDRIEGRRWGGVTEHAESGLLRDASIYAPMAPARYAFAEPATGGEAFIPKRGNAARSLGILQHAAGWYGADVVPRGALFSSGGGAGPVQVIVQPIVGGGKVERAIAESIRFDVRTKFGGDVQAYAGPRRR